MYYQSSSEIQADGLHTLHLMNPNYLGYSDTQPNMLFLNSAALNPHAPPPPQFAAFPLSHDPSRLAHQQDISAMPRHNYSMWPGSVDETTAAAAGNQQTPRGLSLSLSAHHQTGFEKSSINSGDHNFPARQSSPSNAISPAIIGSKYLKAAQELLDEVVAVGNHRPDKAKPIKDSTAANKETESANKGAAATSAASDLTTAQRQEIQMKKAKLNSMLDEVEQRCRQYQQQMQIIVAAFEQAAGTGSARSYTQLALKTILKQFRCLKSTISAQLKAMNKSLGEDEKECKMEGSRLKFVDHHQLGMMQNNAWRPQRGLPERAVSVLRAWLFQHFLHPYPKDSDKQMLAKQTGLTRSQVSNWFINARVRLWKPMVEEMYLEETKKQQQIPSNTDAAIKPEPTPEISAASPPSLPARTNFAQLISSLNMENLPQNNPKKPRHERFSTDNYLPMAAADINIDQQLAAGFGQGNSFSLSLALPPTESFLSHRTFESEGGRINEIMDFQNRKPFPAQLLPDFVA